MNQIAATIMNLMVNLFINNLKFIEFIENIFNQFQVELVSAVVSCDIKLGDNDVAINLRFYNGFGQKREAWCVWLWRPWTSP